MLTLLRVPVPNADGTFMEHSSSGSAAAATAPPTELVPRPGLFVARNKLKLRTAAELDSVDSGDLPAVYGVRRAPPPSLSLVWAALPHVLLHAGSSLSPFSGVLRSLPLAPSRSLSRACLSSQWSGRARASYMRTGHAGHHRRSARTSRWHQARLCGS